MSLSKVVFLALISTAIVTAVPLSKRNVFTGGRLDIVDDEEHCFTLPANVADYCGYSNVYLPNARGHKTVNDAVTEFVHFEEMINSNPQCSDFLGIYLCFHYFPVSGCPHSDSSAYVSLPCKETCEAAKTEECADLARFRKAAWKWPSHMNCDLLRSNSSGELCSDAKEGINRTFIKQEIATTTSAANETATPKPVTPKETTTSKQVVPEVTNTPFVPGPEVTIKEVCPNSCSSRTKVSGSTFTNEKNKHYSFAIKGVVSRYLGAKKYLVSVSESYNVHTCKDGVRDDAPAIGDTATIVVARDGCDGSPDVSAKVGTGETVVIVGTHKSSGGNVELHLDCEDKPVFGDWLRKYDKKNNIAAWVRRGNTARASDCPS